MIFEVGERIRSAGREKRGEEGHGRSEEERGQLNRCWLKGLWNENFELDTRLSCRDGYRERKRRYEDKNWSFLKRFESGWTDGVGGRT